MDMRLTGPFFRGSRDHLAGGPLPRRRLLALAAGIACIAAASSLYAQPPAWPARPLKLVVGYAAGAPPT